MEEQPKPANAMNNPVNKAKMIEKSLIFITPTSLTNLIWFDFTGNL